MSEYWLLVGDCYFTKKATKTTREGGDDKEQRSHRNLLIVVKSSNRAIIIVTVHYYKYRYNYSAFRENSKNTEVLQKLLVLQKMKIGLEMRGGGGRPIIGIKSKTPSLSVNPPTRI